MRPYDEDESLRDYLFRVLPGQMPTETPGVYQAVPIADVKRVQARVQIEVEGLPRLVIPNLDVQFLGLYRDMREAFSMFPPNRVVPRDAPSGCRGDPVRSGHPTAKGYPSLIWVPPSPLPL